MSDVAALADGHWQWSGWLTPKGRVLALFALLKVDAETLHLVLHDTGPGDFASQLRRFVFRSKVAIETGVLEVGGGFEACPGAGGARADSATGGFALDFGGEGGARTLRAGPLREAGAAAAAHARWLVCALSHAAPLMDVAHATE